MTSLPEDLPPLSGEDDRCTAVQRVQQAYAEGHLSHEEMGERLHRALTATTHGELVPVLASLPAEKAGTTATIAAAGGRIRHARR
ncbi:DUF1707 SHOCT-like domain-containing protein [Streptomyces klenkii]